MKRLIAIAALAAAFAAPAAVADHHGAKKTFADLDADSSGGVTLAEIQATKPAMTADKIAKNDTAGNGDISAAEHDAWKAAKADKADKKKDGDKASY
jgi:opacity protein-like surface antigen